MPQGPSEPFYFGREDEQLFGCLHFSPRAGARDSGVVVVPPMDQEYLRAHRGLRQLAVRIAGAGYPVLRFDLFACGDSSGECELGSIERWISDVDTARSELRARTAATSEALVGLRLGALLAARSAIRGGGVPALVLWDPVVSGKSFLASLRRAHEEMIRNFRSRPKPDQRDESAQTDILGFPFPASLTEEIEALDLLDLERTPAERVLLLTNGESAECRELAHGLRAVGASVRVEEIGGPRVWEEDASKALIPHRALETIVSWIAEVLP